MNKAKFKKVGKILLDIALYLFLALCVFSVCITFFAKKDGDGALQVFGYQMRIVTSESMAECELTDVSNYKIKDIPLRSMVFIKVMPDDIAKADDWYSKLEVGDVLTFRYVYGTQLTITHRVVSVTEKEEGGYVIELRGDNKTIKDGQLTQVIDTSIPNNTNYVIGEVVAQSRVLGAVMTVLMHPVGILLAIILPCFLIILFEVIKIMKAVDADKKSVVEEEKAEKEAELEDLRRRIAELEKEKSGDPDNGGGKAE